MSNDSIAQRDTAKELYGSIVGNRWMQLIAGLVFEILLSNYQYSFTLFTPGMEREFAGIPYAKIAGIFSFFILCQTWPVPVSGYLVDKFGIRKLVFLGSAGMLLGWLLGGTIAKSIFGLYICYGVIAGVSTGMINVAVIANAIKWFPDRRGLAVGLTSSGYAGGAAFAIIPIANTISALGWAGTMAVWGIAQGGIGLVMALMLRHPPEGWVPAGWQQQAQKITTVVAQTKAQYAWYQTLRRPEFYLLYVIFICVTTGGLMTTGNLSKIARSLDVANTKMLGLAIIPFTATLCAITNALARIMWGLVSDRLGREHTMALAFMIEAVLIFLVTQITGSPMLFVLLLPLVFLAWGEIFSLFSAVTGDIFGTQYATVNYGMVFTGKGVASIFAGYGAALLAGALAGSFRVPYYIAAILDVLAALLALFALKPLIRSRIAKEVPKEATGAEFAKPTLKPIA